MLYTLLREYLRIGALLSIVIICWKWGDWRHWRKYYPTILFVLSVNLLSSFFTVDFPLWRLDHPLLRHTFSDFLLNFVFFPCVIMLYLPFYPEKLSRKIMQYLGWVLVFVLLEITDMYLCTITYYNGWNIWWSVLIDFAIFLMIRVHYKNPLLAWGITFAMGTILLFIFKFPVRSVR